MRGADAPNSPQAGSPPGKSDQARRSAPPRRQQPRLHSTAHHPVVLAAFGIREADLILLKELTKASDGTRYITDDLNLANLSFLWRHAWLSKLLQYKAEDWKVLLKIIQQDILYFPDPETAWGFVEKIDRIKNSGFSPDELNWLLAADRDAKAATQEADARKFLAALRKQLQVHTFSQPKTPADTQIQRSKIKPAAGISAYTNRPIVVVRIEIPIASKQHVER